MSAARIAEAFPALDPVDDVLIRANERQRWALLLAMRQVLLNDEEARRRGTPGA